MGLFDCTPDELAKRFAEDPQLYNSVKHVLDSTRGRGILSSGIEESVAEIADLVEKANDIARDSDYFVFDTCDSWCDRTGAPGEGYSVYQKVNGALVRKLGVDDSVPQYDEVVKLLKREKVTRVFTLTPPLGGYCGVDHDNIDGDGDTITYSEVVEGFRKGFLEDGIEVVSLNV